MNNFLFCKIFKDAYIYKFGDINNPYFSNENLNILEETLKSYIQDIIGYRFASGYNLGEVRCAFDNIVNNLNISNNLSLIDAINKYKEDYLNMLKKYPYVELLLDVIKRMYDESYDGKLMYSDNHSIKDVNSDNALIHHYKNSFFIRKEARKGQMILPTIQINEINNLEEILEEYIYAIKNSNSFYNIFNNDNFSIYMEDEKIKMIFEGTLLNANSYEFANIEVLFAKYRNFILSRTFDKLPKLNYLGEAFNDDLYFSVKKSDVEYETPEYFSFMLKNTRLELPNVRLACTLSDKGSKIAHIIAIQSSQITPPNKEISEIIKKEIPNTPRYNFFNPDHFISLLLSLGILKGMGINDIVVQDYVPLRYYKTIKDKKMNDEEGEKYIMRVVDKNIYTYFKLSLLCEGVHITSYPDTGLSMQISLDDNLILPNEFLQNLYNMAYEFGLDHAHKKVNIYNNKPKQ